MYFLPTDVSRRRLSHELLCFYVCTTNVLAQHVVEYIIIAFVLPCMNVGLFPII